jgi:hypothetical protein
MKPVETLTKHYRTMTRNVWIGITPLLVKVWISAALWFR